MGFITEDTLKYRMEGDREGDAFQLVLYTLALGLPANLVYEVGVGQSTLALIRAVQRTDGRVISCDINPEIADRYIYKAIPAADDWWGFFPISSEKMFYQLHEKADLIFLDGCHSLSCIAWEVEKYWSLVKGDGMMVLHDTRAWPEGPGKVLDMLIERGFEVVELPFSCGIAIVHKRMTDPDYLELKI